MQSKQEQAGPEVLTESEKLWQQDLEKDIVNIFKALQAGEEVEGSMASLEATLKLTVLNGILTTNLKIYLHNCIDHYVEVHQVQAAALINELHTLIKKQYTCLSLDSEALLFNGNNVGFSNETKQIPCSHTHRIQEIADLLGDANAITICTGTKVTIEEISLWLATSKVESLDLGRCDLEVSSENLPILIDTLLKHQSLSYLDLPTCNPSNSNVYAPLLNSGLRSLVIRVSAGDDFNWIINALKRNTHLKSLAIHKSDNYPQADYDKNCMTLLEQIRSHNYTLTSLEFDARNNVDDVKLWKVNELAQFLNRNRGKQFINILAKHLKQIPVTELLELIKQYLSLEFVRNVAEREYGFCEEQSKYDSPTPKITYQEACTSPCPSIPSARGIGEFGGHPVFSSQPKAEKVENSEIQKDCLQQMHSFL